MTTARKEFRSPVRNKDGFVYEPAGGSSKDTHEETELVALHEVEEEVGLRLHPSRFKSVASRQLAATLSVHQATVFAVELTEEEMAHVLLNEDVVRGVESDSERTYACVFTVKELLSQPLTDWSTLGMVMSALFAHQH